MTPEELLTKAADRIEQGWCQHVERDHKGNVCLAGALNLQDATLDVWNVAVKAVEKELGGRHLPTWNDAPGRVKEEVVATLRNAKRWL